mmetsp:Transcript_15745/g.30539  ORF Transcript_15745/g.30539 Transcript_15745/m.30539 type:complete len:210 (-) Transcript_15745:158-787(-)
MWPFSSGAAGFAPKQANADATSSTRSCSHLRSGAATRQLHSATIINGVLPFMSAAFTSAPALSNASMIFAGQHNRTAEMRGGSNVTIHGTSAALQFSLNTSLTSCKERFRNAVIKRERSTCRGAGEKTYLLVSRRGGVACASDWDGAGDGEACLASWRTYCDTRKACHAALCDAGGGVAGHVAWHAGGGVMRPAICGGIRGGIVHPAGC